MPIFASGDLDEFKIAELKAAGACINGYGLGTQLVTGSPVNGVYKLVEIDTIPVMKESTGKVTYPGRKQIFRYYENGVAVRDRLGLMTENRGQGSEKITSKPETRNPKPSSLTQTFSLPLLQLVMQNGVPIQPPESLNAIAQRTAQSVASLPAATRQIHNLAPFSVEPSPDLLGLIAHTQRIL